MDAAISQDSVSARYGGAVCCFYNIATIQLSGHVICTATFISCPPTFNSALRASRRQTNQIMLNACHFVVLPTLPMPGTLTGSQEIHILLTVKCSGIVNVNHRKTPCFARQLGCPLRRDDKQQKCFDETLAQGSDRPSPSIQKQGTWYARTHTTTFCPNTRIERRTINDSSKCSRDHHITCDTKYFVS
jgi:hypothetical protein